MSDNDEDTYLRRNKKGITLENAKIWSAPQQIEKRKEKEWAEYLKELPQKQEEAANIYFNMIRRRAKQGNTFHFSCMMLDTNEVNFVLDKLKNAGFKTVHWDNFLTRGCIWTSWRK